MPLDGAPKAANIIIVVIQRTSLHKTDFVRCKISLIFFDHCSSQPARCSHLKQVKQAAVFVRTGCSSLTLSFLTLLWTLPPPSFLFHIWALNSEVTQRERYRDQVSLLECQKSPLLIGPRTNSRGQGSISNSEQLLCECYIPLEKYVNFSFSVQPSRWMK